MTSEMLHTIMILKFDHTHLCYEIAHLQEICEDVVVVATRHLNVFAFMPCCIHNVKNNC